MNASTRDPFLDLDLDGLRLIEASAGTGKTFTLATLVTRLVIERDLRVGQILAVTFTKAATQELRERVRKRLALAARLAAGNGELASALDAADSAYAVTRSMIESRLRQEPVASLHARLQRAAYEIDLAAVFTIDGFCARVLGEHALETGQAFVAPDMIGSDRDLRDEVATDLWRSLGGDPLDAVLLQAQWADPRALARDLDKLLKAARVLPPLPPEEADPLPLLRSAAAALRSAFVAHGDTAHALLEASLATKSLNGRNYSPAMIARLWDALSRWASRDDDPVVGDASLERLAPDYLAAKTNKGKSPPRSILFEAAAGHVMATRARDAWLASRRLALIHRVRAQARVRLARLKQQRGVQTYSDLLDGVVVALDGAHGAMLADHLRTQYAVALVDEFQDTDASQWAIFQRVFGGRALFLIGDPKQAIYGFRGGDVHTYRAAARQAEPAPRLEHNFRSRPSLLRAVQALYAQAGEQAFVDPRIRFHAVQPGDRASDEDYLCDDRPAAALTVRVLPAFDDRPAWKSVESRAIATRACVEAIRGALRDGRSGRALIHGKRVQAADIAVLVRSHREATSMRVALAEAGIPAVAAGKQSVFGTEQALELATLFAALLRPDDEGRLRAALATVLIGLSADAIARLDEDPDNPESNAHRDWQLRALAWRERWERHGPLALVADLCAENAPRLLGLIDGERRLTNLLQLGEALQEADALALGMQGLLDWLRNRIAEADDDDETQQLRLESDARCVQILTLHKSKGLEFPLVFLPFAGIGREANPGSHCEYHDGDGRVLQFKPGLDGKNDRAWQDAVGQWETEQRAEDARLLYVGLTRARHAVWLACGPLYRAVETPLAAMLADPAALRTGVAGDIAIDAADLPDMSCVLLPPERIDPPPPARITQRVLHRDWWVYSFSMLAHDAANGTSIASAIDLGGNSDGGDRGAGDEPDAAQANATTTDAGQMRSLDTNLRFSGVRFGNALHLALEQADFARWRDWRGSVSPPGEEAALLAALRREGYADAELADGARLLCELIANTLNVRLPEGAQLSALPADARRAELEFHFAMAPVRVDALLGVLHAHGLVLARQGFGLRRRIEGLMTGKIDLVYVHEGRFHVLDYKSNRLAGYGDAALAAAMRESEYDLQYLIYSLALHRWLRFRLGAAYDYDAHFGGVRYLFCRGLDAQRDGSPTAGRPGIYASKPARALIDALDALFAGDARSAA